MLMFDTRDQLRSPQPVHPMATDDTVFNGEDLTLRTKFAEGEVYRDHRNGALTGRVLQRPALAVLAFDEAVGLGAVRGLEVGGIPVELLLADAHGHIPQEDGLGQQGGVVEVG